MKFPEILKQLRENAGYTQKQVADILNVSKTSVSHYEIGLSTPPLDTILQIAELFDVSLDYLTGRIPENVPTSIFNKIYFKNTTNAALISTINSFDNKHKQLLYELIKCLRTDNLFSQGKR